MTRPAQRPALELADVITRHGHKLGDDLPTEHRRILAALSSCRTAALGGHVETCDHCQHRRIAYNSCRNRHCPKCQASACAKWMEARAQELLPVEYFHVVFTLPEAFNRVALANKRIVYDALFNAVAQTLVEVAANPRHLGAKIGFIAILHTWGQNLSLHPHVHCVIPGGGLSADGSRWVSCKPGFLLPVRILSKVFRGKFIDLLKRAHFKRTLRGVADDVELHALINPSVATDWVVYAKPPFGGPQQVLKYLSRYTHRIAFSNRRLVSMDDRNVTFLWKDYAHGNQPKLMMMEGREFLRRFLMHAAPPGFMRIRHFGLLANRFRKANLARCRELLATAAPTQHVDPPDPIHAADGPERCPLCGKGRMIRTELIHPIVMSPPRLDSS
jgi:hypothetical protein